MMAYDSIIPTVMARYGVPGAAIAVMRNGKLVLARGYGYADIALHRLVEPTSLFRVASLSKPITSAAIMKLVEQGKLGLDDRAFTILSDVRPTNPGAMDPRLLDITVRQLLTHSSGWDRDLSGDPMFMSAAIADAMATTPPASLETIVRYWMSKPLNFTPGARYAYSNLGYAVLGLIIERVSGQLYETYTKANVLSPAGVTLMQLGRTLLSQRATDEVRYYDPAWATSVFPGEGVVPFADGGFYLEPMAAHGGWISSAPDLLRFTAAVDGFVERPDVLTTSSLALMTEKPSFRSDNVWYGFGWLVNAASTWSHDGSLPGSATLLVRTNGNVSWAALFNSRTTPAGLEGIGSAINSAMWAAFGRISSWPTHDLFDQY
jgi:N-acyl-D-amino-acid deacylase